MNRRRLIIYTKIFPGLFYPFSALRIRMSIFGIININLVMDNHSNRRNASLPDPITFLPSAVASIICRASFLSENPNSENRIAINFILLSFIVFSQWLLRNLPMVPPSLKKPPPRILRSSLILILLILLKILRREHLSFLKDPLLL